MRSAADHFTVYSSTMHSLCALELGPLHGCKADGTKTLILYGLTMSKFRTVSRSLPKLRQCRLQLHQYQRHSGKMLGGHPRGKELLRPKRRLESFGN